jgi:hypothetical protein
MYSTFSFFFLGYEAYMRLQNYAGDDDEDEDEDMADPDEEDEDDEELDE